MQIAKEQIKTGILSAAREEFLKSGFEKASIRTITANAKTSKSNLYNYFTDKDSLFTAVLEHTVGSIRAGLALALAENEGAGADAYTPESQKNYMSIVMNFVAGHTAEIRLLLFHSGGSSLAGFKDEVNEKFTDVLLGWFSIAMPDKHVSRLFIRCVACFYITAIEQMLLARVTKEQAEEYLGEFLKFVYGGWSGVMSHSLIL